MRPICTSNTALRPVRLQPHSCGFNYQCWYSKTNIGAVQFVKPEVSMGLLYGVTGCIILLFLCKSFPAQPPRCANTAILTRLTRLQCTRSLSL